MIEEFTFGNDMGYGNVLGERLSAVQAIRRHCWMCQGGHELPWRMADGKVEPQYRPFEEVKSCRQETCWLYPFRTGRDPNRAGHRGNAEHLAKARKSGRQTRLQASVKP